MIKELNKNDYLIYGFESRGSHIIPPHLQPAQFKGNTLLWIMPVDEEECAVKIDCASYTVNAGKSKIVIDFKGNIKETEYPSYPCCDFFGNEIKLDIEGGKEFEKTLSRFYWKNQLCQIAERTYLRNKKSIREGYVLSTLDISAYAGTYPAVDHEFHMKGRFALGGAAETELIKRMLLLQIKIMREDRRKQYRNVCAVQPSGSREYDVWRSTMSNKVRAQMFRITANIEFVEGVYNYYCLSKDIDFIKEYIYDIERNCDYIEKYIDENGFLDSNVYFEDQVIKDYTVLQAQLFASNSFRLMAEIEALLERDERKEHYSDISDALGKKAVQPFPNGFWDNENKRFIDWIDKNGNKHDRIHLLANELPELFGFASEEQANCSRKVIEANEDVFGKFPSFVAARIEDYNDDEIGDGGPYDLCAAGRYWCWDAEYIAFKGNGKKLFNQLMQVAKQAAEDEYLMGERYDMNYVYYNKGKNALKNYHGATRYYEYPNVFIYVLICKYLGIRKGFDRDYIIKPLFENGRVRLAPLGIEFEVKNGEVTEITRLE